MDVVRDSKSNFEALSELLLATPEAQSRATNGAAVQTVPRVSALRGLTEGQFKELEALAIKNHVIVRAFEPLQRSLEHSSNHQIAGLVAYALGQERGRITHALSFLEQICSTFEEYGCPVVVIKSLDHWPDLGSDLDLYTDGEAAIVVEVMRTRFSAKVAERSWGDRLANKWNFIVPGLPELVEVHVGRLGQTGEQTVLTQSLQSRTRMTTVAQHSFRALASEDRFIVSTLQRMYRHFYIRLCDIVDNAHLLDSQSIDFALLQSLGSAAGLWEGVATYLTIVSQYVEAYRGFGIPLPSVVTNSAKFSTNRVHFRRGFLRVPILPDSVNLYAGELKTLVLRGEIRNSFRLSLLPGLAAAAALEMKLTGNDKGIW